MAAAINTMEEVEEDMVEAVVMAEDMVEEEATVAEDLDTLEVHGRLSALFDLRLAYDVRHQHTSTQSCLCLRFPDNTIYLS